MSESQSEPRGIETDIARLWQDIEAASDDFIVHASPAYDEAGHMIIQARWDITDPANPTRCTLERSFAEDPDMRSRKYRLKVESLAEKGQAATYEYLPYADEVTVDDVPYARRSLLFTDQRDARAVTLTHLRQIHYYLIGPENI